VRGAAFSFAILIPVAYLLCVPSFSIPLSPAGLSPRKDMPPPVPEAARFIPKNDNYNFH
jgi:hypothetical protein